MEQCQAIINKFTFTEITTILDLVVQVIIGGFAVYIGIRVTSRQTNTRVLKDYYISEIQKIRDVYSGYLESLYDGTANRNIVHWGKLTKIKSDNIISQLVKDKYALGSHKRNIDKLHLKVLTLVTDSPEYISLTRDQDTINLTSQNKIKILNILKDFSKEFNGIILKVNSK